MFKDTRVDVSWAGTSGKVIVLSNKFMACLGVCIYRASGLFLAVFQAMFKPPCQLGQNTVDPCITCEKGLMEKIILSDIG